MMTGSFKEKEATVGERADAEENDDYEEEDEEVSAWSLSYYSHNGKLDQYS